VDRHRGGLRGLAVIATSVGLDLTPIGLGLTALSAVSWGVGNVLVKRLPAIDPLALAVWLSLVPPLPGLALAAWWTDPARSGRRGAGLVARVGRRPLPGPGRHRARVRDLGLSPPSSRAAQVAPFALLVPFVAAASSALVLGERFGARRLLGMALVLLGLAIIIVRAGAAGVTEPAHRSR